MLPKFAVSLLMQLAIPYNFFPFAKMLSPPAWNFDVVCVTFSKDSSHIASLCAKGVRNKVMAHRSRRRL